MKQNAFLNQFGVPKPVIGMLHLGKLEKANLGNVIWCAKEDAKVLQKGGIDGILLENWQESSVGPFVSKQTANAIDRILANIRHYISIPIGINVLNNDYKVAFAMAKKHNLNFVELDVLVDHVRSDFTYNLKAQAHPFEIKLDPKDVFSYRDRLGTRNTPLICFVQPKHYTLLERNKPLEKSIEQAQLAGAAGIVLTKATGASPQPALLQKAKQASSIPVGVGSGLTKDNVFKFQNADFFIVGSSLERGGIAASPVSLARVKSFMSAVVKLR